MAAIDRVARTLLVALASLVLAGCGLLGLGDGGGPTGPLAYPGGCAAFDLSARRCEAIVLAKARGVEIDPSDAVSIQLLGDPGCELPGGQVGQCVRTAQFVVVVRFVLADGRTLEDGVFCGVGGQFSILCTEDPEVEAVVPTDSYMDVPCTDTEPPVCGTRFPGPDPEAMAAEVPLHVDRLVIPIDHDGAYDVELGRGALANGILEVSSMNVGVGPNHEVFLQGPAWLVIESLEPGGKPFQNYYEHGRRDGVERFVAHVQFDVLSHLPGAAVTITGVAVS